MTPKDALEYLKNRVTKLSLNHRIGNRDIAKAEVKDIVMGIEVHVIPTIEQALNELEVLKKPPTVDEVIKAIQDDVHDEVNYKQEMFYNLNGCTYLSTQNKIKTNQALSPKTLILIGRFYEGLEVEE